MQTCRSAGLTFQFNMVIRKETLGQLEAMLRMAGDYGANAAEFFDLVAAGRAKHECREQVLSPEGGNEQRNGWPSLKRTAPS